MFNTRNILVSVSSDPPLTRSGWQTFSDRSLWCTELHVTLILKIHLAPLDSTARVIPLKKKVVPSFGIRLTCSLRTQLKNVPMTNGNEPAKVLLAHGYP